MKTRVTVQLSVVVELNDFVPASTSIDNLIKASQDKAIELATRSLKKDPMVKSFSCGEVNLISTLTRVG